MVIKANPMPPSDVQCEVLPGVKCCPRRLSNSIRVSWSPPENQLLDIEYYTIHRMQPPFWMGTELGPFQDTIVEICPNEPGECYEFYVFSHDSESDSSVVLPYGAACAGTENICPGHIEKPEFADPTIPNEFALHQNYPNPFNASTSITYELPKDAHVKIEVFNTMGQLVATVLDAEEAAGVHTVEWNALNNSGNRVASGLYLYRITCRDFIAEKKMVLVK